MRGDRRQRGRAPGGLRLATFNVADLGRRRADAQPFERRLAALRPVLAALDADVLCLQEVCAEHPPEGGPRRLLALDALLAGTAYAGFHRAATVGVGDEGAVDIHNLVVASRWPISRVRQVRHEMVPALAYRPVTAVPPAVEAVAVEWDRPLLMVDVTLPGGRKLHVIDLHLRAPLAAAVAGGKAAAGTWRHIGAWGEGLFLAAVKRDGQALEARLLVDSILDADARALIAVVGDFNADARETPMRLILGNVLDTGNPGLADRALVALERGIGSEPGYSTIADDGRRLLVDHILASPALAARFRRGEAYPEALAPDADGVRPSDHAPLVVEFAL